MSFEEMERRYRELQEQRKRGEIAAEEVAQAAKQLRLQDEEGTWWQMRPSDGAWLRWSGAAWEEAQPPQEEESPGPPQTLAQYLRLLLRSLLRGVRRKLILAGIVALATWILHTYLLVGPNGGFAPGTNRTLDMVLALRDRVFSGTLFWTLLAALVTTAIVRLRRVGLRQAASEVRSAPGWLRQAMRSAGPMALPLLLFGGAALALLAGTLMDHRLIVLQLALVGMGILIVRQQSVLWTVLRLGWDDLQRLLRRDDPADLNMAWLGVGTLGLTLGMLGAAVQPFAPYGGIAGVVLLLGIGGYLLARGRNQAKAGRLLSLLLLLGLLALLAAPVLADDGGWSEGGGNLAGWLSSPGAGRALAMGLLPAAGASLGVLLGSMFGGFAGISLGLETPEAPATRRRRRSATARTISPEPGEAAADSAAADSAARTGESGRQAATREGPQPAAEPLSEEAQKPGKATQPGQAARRAPQEEQVAEPGSAREAAKREAQPQAGGEQAERAEQVAKEDTVPETGPPQAESPQEAAQVEGPARSERARGAEREAPGRRGPEAAPEKMGEAPEAEEPGPGQQMQGPRAEEVEQALSDDEVAPAQAEGGEQVADRPMDQPEETTQGEQAARQPAAEEPTAEPGQPRQAAKPGPQARTGMEQSERPAEAGEAESPSRSERARGAERESPGRRGPETPPQQTGEPPEPGPSQRPPAPTAEDVERALGDEEAAAAEATGGEQVARRAGEETVEADRPSQAARRPPDEGQMAEPGPARQVAKRAPDAGDGPRQVQERPSGPPSGGEQVESPETRPLAEQAQGPEEAPEVDASGIADPADTAATLPGIAAPLEEYPWQVEVTGGADAGQRFVLGERTRIGRADDAGVQLHDPRASRRHAVVEQVGDTYQIKDLESGNGTFVNDQRIREATRLRPGDRIRIGGSELVVRA